MKTYLITFLVAGSIVNWTTPKVTGFFGALTVAADRMPSDAEITNIRPV